MQIRLTVLAPYAGHGAGRTCDVLVTAPAGTALAAVASQLAAAVTGPETSASGTTVLHAGAERLDNRRCVLGEPPLVDGAVLSLQVPGPDERVGEPASARLHVVAGPDAGGVHLLHGGPIRIGRSVEADVPLDDPDVSRAHCMVTVGEDGAVTVADRGSTNGTTLDGVPVGERPVRFRPGALLRLGESALRLSGPGDDPVGTDARTTAPDGEGHLRIALGPADRSGHDPSGADRPGHPGGPGSAHGGPVDDTTHGGAGGAPTGGPVDGSRHDGPYGTPYDTPYGEDARGHAREGTPHDGPGDTSGHDDHHDHDDHDDHDDGEHGGTRRTRPATPAAPPAPARGGGRRGLGAWARRLTGGREDLPAPADGPRAAPDTRTGARPVPAAKAAAPAPVADTWPDPATVLLTALGPGPRLWERAPHHPEALVVRLGTADRAELSGVPVTVGLREAGSLGLAGPADRLAGLARSVVAQLAALHSPADLEIVLISADRNRSLDERRRAWGWLGWLPHVRPAHGQDARLLLAYDREQAQARTAELTRRLDDGPLGPGWPSADRAAVAEAAARHEGPVTVVVVDGDPGSAALRETVARLAGAGAAAGIHLLCLAEAPAASPASPVAATYESACAGSFAFRECGAAVLLSGDVATALRLLRTAGGRAAGHGTVGVVDAVSVAWADRFGRALAPLRTDAAAVPGARAAALPPSSRLLDELGLGRATPASLMARWASAGDGTAVLGTGPRGPLAVDLTKEGPHLLIEGPAGSGRTELLRSVAASLAAGGRPDRIGLLLVDGAGGERGEGLAVCTELPHVTEHLVASDPVRMREFAQALGAELKRRAEILGDGHFADRRGPRTASASGAGDRLIGQRSPSAAESLPQGARATVRLTEGEDLAPRASGRTAYPGDLDSRTTGRTLRTGDGTTGSPPGTRSGREVRGTYGGDVESRASGRAPYPAEEPGGRPGGRTTYSSGADDPRGRPSSRTLRTNDDEPGERPGGRIPRTGDGDAADGPGSRAGDLGGRASGRLPHPGSGESGDRRAPRAGSGSGDLGGQPSGRILHGGDGERGGGHTGRAGAGDPAARTGAEDLGGRTGGRIPHPGTGGLDGQGSWGRGADERSGGRARSGGDAFLSDTPSGRLPRRDGGLLDDRPSSRTLRTGDGEPGGQPGGRISRPGAADLGGPGSGRVSRPGEGDRGGDLGGYGSGRVSRTGEGDLGGYGSRTSDGGYPGGRGSRAGEGARIPAPAVGETGAVRGSSGHLPRLVVLVDDFDALVAPALGAPGRPAAGSVVRALEAVARNGERLGVHLVATSARPDRTADTELAHGARLRIVLDAPPATSGPDVPAAGRGRLGHPDGRVTPFQAGRVTGRIPRTATLRPTVVPLEWERMGDPPTRRPVRELGNGPTDLALLASALDRAARSVEATPVPPLTPATHA
ncbi:FtsK/SpoIIIE domain-containing protein [Streptomyces sp. NPDC059247]|uniref:FtsK/SpoIIIE domain-containing protein n=1 Tax=Streptomyces sp. NPDC059247 TaxID=3346790 RepID=UPI0036B2FF88